MVRRIQRFATTVALILSATSALAQVTPAAGVTPPDDNPTIKIGGTIFAQYVYFESPLIKDAAGNTVNQSAFDVTRAYINITGNINHLIAYRITPDIARETSTSASLTGSAEYRLKYAYGQLNLDDWTNKGSWVRMGIQQTPWVDYSESIYRYRFQGTIFTDREGFLSSSDAGLSGKWVFPQGYGEIQGGFFNGENYNKVEVNDQKSFQLRATVRPMPLGGAWKGLRFTGFIDSDAPVGGGERNRLIGNVTYEHPRVNASFEYLTTKDKVLPTAPTVEGKGWSAWVTPKLSHGFELLLRHDELKQNKSLPNERKRDIVGLAYWMNTPKGTSTAVMLDYDSLRQTGFSPARPDDTRYGVKLLFNF